MEADVEPAEGGRTVGGTAAARPGRRRKKKLTGSFVAKVTAFFLLAICVFLAAVGGLFALYLVGAGYYTNSKDDIFLSESYGTMLSDVYRVRDALAEGNLEAAKEVCEGKNVEIALLKGSLEGDSLDIADNPAVIWASCDEINWGRALSEDTYLQFPKESLGGVIVIRYQRLYPMQDYVFRVYINMDFPEADRYAEIYRGITFLYDLRYHVLLILGICIFLGLNSFLFLMCSAGHRNDAEGIQPSVFFCIPLDLYTVIFGIVAFFPLLLLFEAGIHVMNDLINVLMAAVLCTVAALLCTFYLRELAVRMKLGGWWKNTLIYRFLRMIKRMVKFFWRCLCRMVCGIPTILNILILYLGVSILEFLGICVFVRRSAALPPWLLEKFVLFAALVYVSLICKKLLDGSRALAEGRQEEKVDTKYMFGEFKECGENLNNIGQGISIAVAERLKSERMKTELITNVSHDIKTPLTSIINYANLIAGEHTENEKIREYSEVLVRQSGRLKKLLEDLLEASKATTGNLEVNLQPCEVGVILSQAVGEYQQRMEEKQLELIIAQPEQEVSIMADGRHLWRVFDNLLNNICKYAREDSRVYLSVEAEEKNVKIIFRNMSKYALSITPEELQERFVRGDRSRHMEGNGLGLSIAGSLTELMDGRMEVVTDGDLFKVSLCFSVI